MDNVIVQVDGIGINATHFAAMKKEDAVKEMEVGNILKTHGKDAKWAATVYDHAVKAVADAKAKQEESDKRKRAENKNLGIDTEAVANKVPPGAEATGENKTGTVV